jgi:hypothetical protein
MSGNAICVIHQFGENEGVYLQFTVDSDKSEVIKYVEDNFNCGKCLDGCFRERTTKNIVAVQHFDCISLLPSQLGNNPKFTKLLKRKGEVIV